MYGLITYLRNKLFDCGVLKTQTHSLLTIGVGNLKVGGTGKTPLSNTFSQTSSPDITLQLFREAMAERARDCK